jgi:hypothetical protein
MHGRCRSSNRVGIRLQALPEIVWSLRARHARFQFVQSFGKLLRARRLNESKPLTPMEANHAYRTH